MRATEASTMAIPKIPINKTEIGKTVNMATLPGLALSSIP
jgi:hypothetical protein